MQLQELALARTRYARIRRACSIALLDAWGLAIFAGLTMVCGISSPSGLVLGMAMALVAIVEFRESSKLRRLDRDAPEQPCEPKVQEADPTDQHHQPQQVDQVRGRIGVGRAARPGAESRGLERLGEGQGGLQA